LQRGGRIFEESHVRAAIVNSRTVAMVPKAGNVQLIAADRAPEIDGAISLHDAIEAGKSCVSAPRATSGVAYIIFTSGSTGVPKGAMITHGNALSFLDWCSSEFRPGEDDRFTNYSPLHFDPSVFDVYSSIKHGASVHLVADELAKRPAALAAFIAARRLTFWCSTPSALMMLLRFGELDVHDCSSLKIVAFGGEVFPARQLRELKQKWRSAAFYNLYGPTETTTACTFARIPDEIPADRAAPYPIGFPCSHCSAAILDDQGEPISAGTDGLLHISGPSVFAGYWNRPAETAASIVERDGIRWYNTGDVVRWNSTDGYTYVARKDGMVKRRGFRIEVGEIERALYLHPSTAEAAVVAVSDPDSTVTIAAFLAWSGPAPSTVELKTFCAKTLPAYMSPDLFIFLDRLPRTSTDKVDIQALKSQVLHASAG
jgi:amino acid adenylation domain-containing protein